jgi:hypothetical protein
VNNSVILIPANLSARGQYNISCFAIEDIYYYKGNNYIYTPYSNKLQLLKQIFNTEITQNILNHNFTIFGLPLVYMDFNLLLNDIQKLPYKIIQIKFRFFEKKNARKIMTMKYFKPSIISKNNIIPLLLVFWTSLSLSKVKKN